MADAVREVLDLTVQAYSEQSTEIAFKVEPLEDVVDTLKDIIKSNHIVRLNDEICTMQHSVVFLEIVHDLEKISDHCSNIAIYTIQLNEGAVNFDTHEFSKEYHASDSRFAVQHATYEEKYLSKVESM